MISSHDVIVVGAGPAGIGAALAAARNGARTLLIEDSGMAGGCWTLGLQNHVTCMHDHRKLIIHGIALELMQRLAATGEAEEPEEKLRRLPRTWYCAFDPEGLKYTLDQMLLESGVEILYHTRCVDTVCDAGGRVTGVVTESKSGRRSFTARIVADCSGDADAAAFAGAATRKGRDSDGRMQPVTTAFMLANVDYDRAAAHLAAHPGFMAECEAKARKLGELDMPISPYPGCRTMIDGVTYHNMTRITGIDGTRAEDLTRAEIEGRRQARLMAAFFRKYIPGFERSALIATGSVHESLVEVLSGGLLFGAVFMATDYVTSPFTLKGKLLYGICLGVVTFAIRYWGSYTEGVSFALLFMNLWVPFINDATRQTPYGYVKPAKKAGKEGASK